MGLVMDGTQKFSDMIEWMDAASSLEDLHGRILQGMDIFGLEKSQYMEKAAI